MLSSFASKFNLCRFNEDEDADEDEVQAIAASFRQTAETHVYMATCMCLRSRRGGARLQVEAL